MDLTSILIGMAVDVGAPMVKDILERKFGPGSGQLADAVIKSIANQADTTPQQLPEVATKSPEVVRDAIVITEGIAPELIGLYTKGLEGQFALLSAESAEGPLQSGWRWGWMYLLAFFWIWLIVLLPIVNALLQALGSGVRIESIGAAVLLTLPSWFIALYMGGHTVKELGKNALDAITAWREGRAK